VNPIPDTLLLGKSGGAGNRIRTSGSVARNFDNWTTEALTIGRNSFIISDFAESQFR
jgi:hypothetical protein